MEFHACAFGEWRLLKMLNFDYSTNTLVDPNGFDAIDLYFTKGDIKHTSKNTTQPTTRSFNHRNPVHTERTSCS